MSAFPSRHGRAVPGLVFPVPDQLAVLVDILHPVKGDLVRVAVGIGDLEGKVIVRRQLHPPDRYPDHLVIHAVVVAEHEAALREIRIPAYPVEQFMDGDHVAFGP